MKIRKLIVNIWKILVVWLILSIFPAFVNAEVLTTQKEYTFTVPDHDVNLLAVAQRDENQWWEWGWSSLKKDYCPEGDYSDSYYDGKCWIPENNLGNSSELSPWTNNMSSWADVKDIDSSSQNSSEWQETMWFSQELLDAYTRAYKNGITTINTVEEADLGWNLTRIAMAKMLSQYAINVLWKTPDITRQNKFNDVSDELDSQYDSGVTLAYQLWIMWINMLDNNFRPFDLVSRAEFVTALSRMRYWTMDGGYEGTPEFYKNHMEKLVELWIVTVPDPTILELRWYVMLMLMRSATNK